MSGGERREAPAGAATRDAVLRAVTALGQRVKAAGGSGLITFSGHGAASPDAGRAGATIGATIAVAPADVALNAAGEVEGLVTLGELQQALGPAASDVHPAPHGPRRPRLGQLR